MPDVRRSLAHLKEEWSTCTRCELGVRRLDYDMPLVFGEGRTRGVLFINEGPNWMEEKEGRPLSADWGNKRGEVFHRILQSRSLQNFYVTNLVLCRSAEPWIGQDGQPMFRKQRRGPPLPMFKDKPPEPLQWKACLERLYEEIYIVDPVLIVTMGSTATEVLLGHKGTIGKVEHVSIPGAAQRAVLTEKLRAWYRKHGGELHAPTEQNEVRYSLLPTLSPGYVADLIEDRGPNSPFNKFYRDISMAAKIYQLYCREVGGAAADPSTEELPEDVRASLVAHAEG